MKAPAKCSVLIVEDELIVAKDLQISLREMGYDCFAIASSAEEAIARTAERCPDIVLMDIRIKGAHDGIHTAAMLLRRHHLAIIYLTAHEDEAMVERAKKTEPYGYLLKPVRLPELLAVIEIARYKIALENARKQSAALEVRNRALLAARKLSEAAHHQVEIALRASDDRFQAVIGLVHDYAIFMLDAGGRVVSWNTGAERLKGYREGEIIGKHFSIFYYPRDVEDGKPERELTIAAAEGRLEDEGPRIRKDGSEFIANVIITALRDPTGAVQGFIKVTRDITAAKSTEQKLRASEAFLDRVSRVAGIGGWEFELATGAVQWSAETYRINDLDPAHGTPGIDEVMRYYAPSARPILAGAIAEAAERGRAYDLELPMITAKGRHIWVRAIGSAERENGKPVRLVGALQDITARRRAETTLADERELMNSLLDTLPDQVYFKDRDHRYLRINNALALRLGLANSADAVGRSELDYFDPARALKSAAMERRIMESDEPILDLEERDVRPNRASTWQLTSRMPLHDAENRIIGTYGISRDITARKQIEAELAASNERFAVAADSAGIGIWEFDIPSNTLSWDAWMHRIYGVSQDSGVEPYARWRDCLHPEDRKRCEEAISAAIGGGREFNAEFRIIRADGETRHVKATSWTSRAADGSALKMIGVNFDVTEQRRTEYKLHETSSLLRTVLDSAAEMSIIATDPSLTIKIFNAGAERLLGYSSEEVVGRMTPLLLHDPEEVRVCGEELSAQIGRRIEGGEIFKAPSMHGRSREWRYVRKDGGRVVVDLVVTPMQTYEGELLGYVGVAQDVSQQKQYEESLRRATQEAQRANGAKSLFLANMSHEIRTPMNAVIGLTYLLGQTSLSAEQSRFLAQINVASKSLLAVITDVLDLSKIEAGELMISRVTFSPRVLLQGLHDIMHLQAELKGITLDLDLADDLPAALQGDAARLSQILTNLLSNAIKFTERGGVTLRVRQLESTAEGISLCFTVRDTGIGIDPAAQARLFTPFIQADESITRRYGGTGLGLSIIQALTKLMGGTVDFTSTVGVGSEFRVILGFAAATAESLAAEQPVPLSRGARPLAGMQVLVADDYDLNLVVTQRILEQAGALVWLANNGQDAIDQLRLRPTHFDVVLMDVQMPLMDGYEATRRIRADLGLPNLPIIALTAGALSSERQRATAVGMNDFVIKPFDAATLISSIMRHAVIARVPAPLIDPGPQAATGPLAWPEIDGIDMQDARNRLCDDAALFRSLLQRFLGDFSDIGAPSSGSVPLAEQASRLHKLRGAAGMLGAKAIQHLAARAEAASMAGDGARAAELSVGLAAHLEALRSGAAGAFAGARRAGSMGS